ncbi:apyrase isoform X1 [Scaptodrosophila lebanonensis]|uniref:apyrase n=1 Tax=Drosophila lebanonensis TaxID=7225 RepID=A0A6J2TSN8_DROLE|nr:apyrase isoform X1 [Scaptodrosophila lebanonensis]
MEKFYVLLLVLTTLCIQFSQAQDRFPISIIHINDFHARFEPTDTSGGTCDEGEQCIGGYARTAYTVKRLLDEQKDQNPIFINAGDSFQGTLWYNIGRWNVTQQFLNMVPADAMTLGNHEFDHGVEGLVPFLETIDTQMLVANMDASHEPTLEGKFKKSTILERSGRKIGLIGVILETTYDLANTGKLIFQNESEAIREEAVELQKEGADIIIVISHCGYDVDKEIARQAGDIVDVIVGAHSHTFLYTGTPPGPDTPAGDYPTEHVHGNGHRLLIVQASSYARYVGNITVYFDDEGNVVDYEGAPIYMSSDVPQDNEVLMALKQWQVGIDEVGNQVVGSTLVSLQQAECSRAQCNLGDLYTDAMVHAFIKNSSASASHWSKSTIGLANQVTFTLESLPVGDITYKKLVGMCPWADRVYALTLPGQILLDVLESSVADMKARQTGPSRSQFFQVSGLRVIYNLTESAGNRIVSVHTRCIDSGELQYKPLDVNKDYRIAVLEYLVKGTNGTALIKDNAKDIEIGPLALTALMDYLDAVGPITNGLEKRIQFVT